MLSDSQRGWTAAASRIFGILAASFFLAGITLAQSSPQEKPAPQPQSGAQDKQPEKDQKPSDPTATRLRIEVTANDKPVGNASVYVKFYTSGGLFRKDKLAELNLKTNEDGSVKVPEVPRGKILIQVIAKGWKTYGQWYDVEDAEKTIQVKLVPPTTRWY